MQKGRCEGDGVCSSRGGIRGLCAPPSPPAAHYPPNGPARGHTERQCTCVKDSGRRRPALYESVYERSVIVQCQVDDLRLDLLVLYHVAVPLLVHHVLDGHGDASFGGTSVDALLRVCGALSGALEVGLRSGGALRGRESRLIQGCARSALEGGASDDAQIDKPVARAILLSAGCGGGLTTKHMRLGGAGRWRMS